MEILPSPLQKSYYLRLKVDGLTKRWVRKKIQMQGADGFFTRPSRFGNGYCLRRTNLDAALTAQTLIHIDRLGLPVLDFKHAGRARIHAFALAVTLALVDSYGIHRFSFTSSASAFS
jgi:hypothetical protein